MLAGEAGAVGPAVLPGQGGDLVLVVGVPLQVANGEPGVLAVALTQGAGRSGARGQV